MARAFESSNSDNLSAGVAVFGVPPFTIACWCSPLDATANHRIYTEAASAGNAELFDMVLGGAIGGDPLRAVSWDGGSLDIADTSIGYSANAWQHLAGVFGSTVSRAAYIGGGSKGTNSGGSSPAGLDASEIGRWAGADHRTPLDGSMHSVSGWDSVLTDAQVAELGAGRNPLALAALPKIHLPLTGGVHQMISGGPAFADNGTSEGSHRPLGW